MKQGIIFIVLLLSSIRETKSQIRDCLKNKEYILLWQKQVDDSVHEFKVTLYLKPGYHFFSQTQDEPKAPKTVCAFEVGDSIQLINKPVEIGVRKLDAQGRHYYEDSVSISQRLVVRRKDLLQLPFGDNKIDLTVTCRFRKKNEQVQQGTIHILTSPWPGTQITPIEF
ncbi:MAG TPA: hypothetical protein VLB02_02090 [Candidatus Paceibacterota bacterium]|nr:hypothetical protein [Candidatus Paceibacterota bacterium]